MDQSRIRFLVDETPLIDVLERADSLPSYHQWSVGKLQRQFSADELRTLALFVRDNTGAFVTRMRKIHLAEFITEGITDEIEETYSVDNTRAVPLSSEYLSRADD